ncbi:hypothetical protein QJQ45_026263 [Haematococcus lacustris]|nr:hypothetical protein QJQ45_026263 [Haematococcus lacustris]
MQHQVTVDGGASATDGYSPASEATPAATRLLDLPPALLDDIACRVMQLGARSLLHLTCRAFSQAHLLHAPALRIQLGRQCCDLLLTPRVVAALQARTSKLALTLWQPETEDSECYREQMAPTLQLQKTEYTQHYTDLLAHALAKLDNCAAVEVCKLVSSGTYKPNNRKHLCCPPGLAQHLLDSFPSLTALTLEGLCVSNDALASLLSHPPLALQLQQVDIANIISMVGDEPEAVGTLFQGLQLKQLSIASEYPFQLDTRLLPSFQPLAQHLTQLHLVTQDVMLSCDAVNTDLSNFMEYLQPLAQLQVLTISHLDGLEGLTELLQALPQLHTLQLPDATVWEQDLDTLLAATQLTSLLLDSVEALDTSYADVPCSWQRLELTGRVGWKAITYLPLHSLSQPLVLGQLHIRVEDISDPEIAAGLHLLAYASKVPVQIKEVQLTMMSREQLRTDLGVISPTLLRQQRVDLAQLVALLQPLQCCCVGKVMVYGLHEVTATDVLALAPLCRDCTHFELYGGSIEPSLDFWHQLVQLMPAVQKVRFIRVEGCVSAAMHDSLQLMAEQPWARWLHVKIRNYYSVDAPPACWQANSWLKTGIIKCVDRLLGLHLHSRASWLAWWVVVVVTVVVDSQQTVLAVSQRDMQHQVTVDGGASATDGYSPASEAPPAATRLLDLPPALLDDIACRVMQLGARSLLHLTCRAFSQAHLLHVPALRIQLGRQCCDQLLTPRVVAALQARTSKLALTLWQPKIEDSELYTDQLAHTLPKLDNCSSPAVTLDLFQGARLKQLKLEGFRCPLAQHLTQLHLTYYPLCGEDPEYFVEYLQPLAQLHVLTLSHLNKLQGLTELLQALPQLHTLQLPGTLNWGQQQLNVLLAATQITSLQLELGWTGVERLNTSRADAPCSWQRLELLGTIDWKAVAYLPLHSLSQPLVLNCLNIGVEDISNPEVAAALHNMAYACKVPVKIKSMRLYMLNAKERRCGVITPALLQQQRVDLAQLVAMLQQLQCCGEVKVHDLHGVTAADVVALAPMCRDCTHFELWGGSLAPSLEFWRQLVQLMPAVQQVEYNGVEGCVSAAMHESLQLMAEQPWARWLDIKVYQSISETYEVPACWKADSWSKRGLFKVTIE